MSRRNAQMFNLSFLDLLSGALGAVIFLFIITPRGGEPPARIPQVVVSIDTVHNQIFGGLHDSLWTKAAGDTLLVLISDFQKMPSVDDCPACPPPVVCPQCPVCPDNKPIASNTGTRKDPHNSARPVVVNDPGKKDFNQKDKQEKVVINEPKDSKYKGDPPSVPCKVSFEIAWDDIKDNVDLFVCKDGNCVYGARRKSNDIGFWDSGKSKTSWLGGDLRTTQEAVRQFDRIIPGSYNVYAQFKRSQKGTQSVAIKGLIYTKGKDNAENGERFYTNLPLNEKERTLLGTVELKKDGTFTFTKKIKS